MSNQPKKRVVLAVHGGAGVILRSNLTPELEKAYRSALKDAMAAGYSLLVREEDVNKKKDGAVDAVELAVRCMENCPLFNAGKGSVFTHDEKIRMDAAIMTCSFDQQAFVQDNDSNRKEENTNNPHKPIQKRKYPKTPLPATGAVAGVSNIKNPISLARAVMERTPHVFMIGQGAEEFARQLPKEANVEVQPDEYFWTERRWKQLVDVKEREHEQQRQQKQQVIDVQLDHSINSEIVDCDKKFGTVGCIALYRPDPRKNRYQLASATSTGGMTNVRHHRVGDSSVIGAGTYANHLCAVSCTGHGEWFIKCVAAHDIAKRLEYKYGYGDSTAHENNSNISLRTSLEEVIFGTLLGDSGAAAGDGGAIALDKDGNFAASMNCAGMYHGWVFEDGEMETKIFWDDE